MLPSIYCLVIPSPEPLPFPPPFICFVQAIVLMFEDRLKVMTPGLSKITYDIQQLFGYLDSLPDISCLVCVGREKKRVMPSGFPSGPAKGTHL